ncbi:membrane spanning protein [Staphylococcus saccharolyticus]|uniref:Membrane spanning protein n=1 Tax=Staphylococcus saccharolyticus TaxID=33028 RepID=A0A380GX59_9STAP|nr:membrane spanning protein [Staphylococcus saccharolyticus]
MILTILLIFFCIRLISLKISMQHAKQLKADGTVEYGIKNSKFLAITHGLIYISAAVEAFIRIHLTSLIAHWLNHIDHRLYHAIYSH